jgi:catechol 2,3-dioxygenase-like lactoylglutathione lyase family enzyme
MSTQIHTQTAPRAAKAGPPDMKLEIVVLPVADVGRARRFYESLGWRVDADFIQGDDWHVVQMTPPSSQCAIIFGKGIVSPPRPLENLVLAVTDIEAARADLVRRGVTVGEVFHEGIFEHKGKKGRDPEGRPYQSWATFSDPDGNGWLVQEIKTRLPGRGSIIIDVASLSDLLKETEGRHGAYEATAPKHHWSSWYAAYMFARNRGMTADDAVKEAALYMKNLRQ